MRVTFQATVAATVGALRGGIRVTEIAVTATLYHIPHVSLRPENVRGWGELTQMRPACQLSGTVKLTEVYASACHLTAGAH